MQTQQPAATATEAPEFVGVYSVDTCLEDAYPDKTLYGVKNGAYAYERGSSLGTVYGLPAGNFVLGQEDPKLVESLPGGAVSIDDTGIEDTPTDSAIELYFFDTEEAAVAMQASIDAGAEKLLRNYPGQTSGTRQDGAGTVQYVVRLYERGGTLPVDDFQKINACLEAAGGVPLPIDEEEEGGDPVDALEACLTENLPQGVQVDRPGANEGDALGGDYAELVITTDDFDRVELSVGDDDADAETLDSDLGSLEEDAATDLYTEQFGRVLAISVDGKQEVFAQLDALRTCEADL